MARAHSQHKTHRATFGLTLAVASLTSFQAFAQCAAGSGSLSLTASEASTTQALEIMRDRRLSVCGPGGGECTAVTPAAFGGPNVQPSATQSVASAPAAQSRPTAPRPPAASARGLKDDPVTLDASRRHAVWAEGYADWERDNNAGRAHIRERFTSRGLLAGLDRTFVRPGAREGIQLGAFTGYNTTRGETDAGTLPNGNAFTDKSQRFEGAMFGLYGTYFKDRFAADVAVKIDAFDASVTAGCPSGTTGLTNYILAANAYYRHDVSRALWLEPTAGFRYITSNYGNGGTALGLDDGHALRLLAGLRVGTDWVGRDRSLYSFSVLGALYSDVSVNGFATIDTTTNERFRADQGELRVLGQLRASMKPTYGLSYYGQLEVRGGEDYSGVGGKLGFRYEW